MNVETKKTETEVTHVIPEYHSAWAKISHPADQKCEHCK